MLGRLRLGERGDGAYDGRFIGAGGATFDPQRSLDQIPAITPESGPTPEDTVVWVNGIMSDKALQERDLQTIANRSHINLVGIHNATGGMIRDLGQCLRDKLGMDGNKATDTVAGAIRDRLSQNEDLHLVGHSQGALIISRAVKEVKEEMEERGLSEKEAENALSHLKITTLGGCAYRYEDGPEYRHYLNLADGVPMLSGLGLPFSKAGENSEKHLFTKVRKPREVPSFKDGASNYFARLTDETVHGATQIYLDHALKDGFLVTDRVTGQGRNEQPRIKRVSKSGKSRKSLFLVTEWTPPKNQAAPE